MNIQTQQFILSIKKKYPEYFKNKIVVDFGSLDVNGTNRIYFKTNKYVGVDLAPGKNVDIVCPAKQYPYSSDVVITTNMLEHDKDWKESLKNMVNILTDEGLLIVVCPTNGAAEHGTHDHRPDDSPFTLFHYENIDYIEFLNLIKEQGVINVFDYIVDLNICALYFYGFKNLKPDIKQQKKTKIGKILNKAGVINIKLFKFKTLIYRIFNLKITKRF
jgi:SAM-dependent methyltransferase